MTRSSPRSPTSPRAVPTLALALVALVALAACGEPASAPRYAVAQREFDWTRVRTGPEPAPLGLSFDFEHDAQGWRLADGREPQVQGGRLVARGLDRIGFRSPERAPLDAELHHRLAFGAATTDVSTVRVRWRAEGQPFSDGRATTLEPLAAVDGLATYAVSIDALRALHAEGDATEASVQLELLFQGLPGSRPEVQLASVHLASDYDAEPRAAQRLTRRGVARTGTTLLGPGTLECPLTPGPRDRLRLALALAGATDGAATVSLALRGVDGPPTEIELASGAAWHELVLDLSPARGEPTTLVVTRLAGAGVLLVGGALRLAPDTSDLPDVVLYLEDTLRADRLGAYGYDLDTDPHLRAVAADGVLFERAYAASNWTRPSVSSLLTSLDPVAHGNVTHLDRVSAQAVTLAETLAAQGYQPRSFVTNYHGGAWSGLDQGFDVSAEPPAWGASRVASTLTSAVLREPLARMLAECRDERLFVYVHSLDPHRPYDPPMDRLYPLLEAAAARDPASAVGERPGESLRYDAEVRHNDDQLAALDAALTASGRSGDSLLAFVSDHGEAFGEHGAFEHRESLHVEELHVPLIMRWPGRLPAGRRVDAPVGLADVAPTLLGLLDLSPPEGWRGRDLSGLALGDAASARTAGAVLVHTEYAQPRDGLLQELALIDTRFKLVAGVDPTGTLLPRALFDLDADPGEHTDLAADPAHADTLAALLSLATARLAESRRDSHADDADADADAMDPAQRQWMEEMGYLGR